ncbi:MAG: pyridoxamine 5'-phosphate oxidase family protein [Bacteroidota bacterium]
MGKRMPKLTQRLIDFIKKQPLYFVATAMEDGRINISPKGLDSFRVIDENNVLWLNLTGSGNETAAHLKYQKRMTIMFCAFEGAPLILRLYGKAKAYHGYDDFWQRHIGLFPKSEGKRQLIHMSIELVQTSCGFGVPLMDFKQERTELVDWAKNKGEDGLREYWESKNSISLDGYPTNIFKQNP